MKRFHKKNLLPPNRKCCLTQLKGTFANPPLDELTFLDYWNIFDLFL